MPEFELIDPYILENKSIIGGSVIFSQNSKNAHRLLSNVTFKDNAINNGSVIGDATFNNNSKNIGDITTGIFNNSSENLGIVQNAIFNNTSKNSGVISEEGKFSSTSTNDGFVEILDMHDNTTIGPYGNCKYIKDNDGNNIKLNFATLDPTDGLYYVITF